MHQEEIRPSRSSPHLLAGLLRATGGLRWRVLRGSAGWEPSYSDRARRPLPQRPADVAQMGIAPFARSEHSLARRITSRSNVSLYPEQ
jgi:hypothetical protein